MKKKLYEISAFEVILSFFVILIHILSEGIHKYVPGSILSAAAFFISRSLTFVVPAFIMVSATKFSYNFNSEAFNYWRFLKSKIIKIYIPYLIAVVVYYLYFVYHRSFFSFSISDIFWYMCFGSVAAPFYFIIIIMQFYILAPFSLWLYKKTNPKLCIGVAFVFSFLFMYLLRYTKFEDRMFFKYTIFWFIGILFGQNYQNIVSRLFSYKRRIIIFGIAFTLLYSGLSYFEFLSKNQSFVTEAIKLLFSIAATFMWFILAPQKLRSFYKYLSPATFYIYLWHSLCIFEAQHILDKLGFLSVSLRLALTAVFTFIISITSSVLYSQTKLKFKNFLTKFL